MMCRLYESIREDFGKKETYNVDFELEVPFRHYIFRANLNENEYYSTHFMTNQYGYRGENFTIEKEKDTFRIIAIGDSTTFGVGTTDDLTTYPGVLSKKLKDEFPSQKWEVINAGLPGYSSTHAYIFFLNELLKLNPDFIIIFFGWNDLNTSVIRGWNKDRRFGFFYGQDTSCEVESEINKLKNRLLKYSAFMRRYDRIIYKINKHRKKRQQKLQKVLTNNIEEIKKLEIFQDWESRKSINMYQGPAKEIFTYNLINLLDFAKVKKVRTLILTWPTLLSDNMSQEEKLKSSFMAKYYIYSNRQDYYQLYKEYNDIIRDIAGKYNTILIDVAEIFKKIEYKSDYFFDLVHLSDKGNSYLADIILEKIKNERLMKQNR